MILYRQAVLLKEQKSEQRDTLTTNSTWTDEFKDKNRHTPEKTDTKKQNARNYSAEYECCVKVLDHDI